EEDGRAWCCGIVDLAWSEEEVANRHKGLYWGSFFMKGRDYLNSSRSMQIGSPSGFVPRDGASRRSASLLVSRPQGTSRHQKRRRLGRVRPYHDTVACRNKGRCRNTFSYRDVLPRRNRVAVVVPFPVATPSRWPRGTRQRLCVPRVFQVPVLACSCVPWLADGPFDSLCVPFACWACRGLQASSSAWFLLCLPCLLARCLELEGLSCSEVVSISWAPHPREPIEGVLWATSMPELAVELTDSRAEGKMRLTPLLPSIRGSSSRELGVGRVAEAAVASCVVSSSESECCELLYLVLFLCANSWWHRRVRLPDLVVCPESKVAEAAVAPCVVSSSESECCELLYLGE
ncbi:hypothetical protein Taro_054773, partial [Colocasia esculenta]|nr:hypothetical protein [Colocasia esculenta]